MPNPGGSGWLSDVGKAHASSSGIRRAADGRYNPSRHHMPLTAGRRLGPYEIVRTIGSGGMGEVYEARDTRLDRRVALKTLRPELLADVQSRRRFEREARALSALNHPNICTVFDVGRHGDIDFIVMEYIEGHTLDALLDRQALPESVVVGYAGQIAEALAEAHEHGVLHRDMKPQNVMITPRGHVKVLDFGLSTALAREHAPEAATLTALSDAAVVLGTAPYMSPEQVRGEPVDARTDAFSLGCLLYEAVSGHTPFHARTPAETMSSILTKEPVPLTRTAPGTSPELQRIVRKCLEKEKSRRYQTVRDVATDLEALRRDSQAAESQSVSDQRTDGPGWRLASRRSAAVGIALLILLATAVVGLKGRFFHGTTSVRSMAILPFKPLATGEAENYLGLGIADALISRVSGTPNLVVRPTSAVRRYAADQSDALAAAAELKVDAVLDGTWQRDADRLRLSVNLLRAVDGASLWTDRFDVPATDVFALQDRVSERLAERLRLELHGPASSARDRRGTRNPEAFETYLKARFYLSDRGYSKADRANTDTAIQLLERATSLDPAYADAYAALGFALAHTALFIEDSQALMDRAKQATDRAAALTAGLAQVHLNRAAILWSWYEGWRLADSIREYRRAEQLDPALNDIEVTAGYAHLGFLEEWRRAGERVIERDPTSRQARATFVNEFFLLNLPDEGIAAQQRLLNEAPDHRYFLLKRQVARAAPVVEQRAARDPDSIAAQADLALLRALQGRHADARAVREIVLQKIGRTRFYHHVTYTFARMAALAGDSEEAARWLEETIAWGFPCYPMFSTDSFLDPVRHTPRVQAVLAKLKTDWDGYRAALQ